MKTFDEEFSEKNPQWGVKVAEELKMIKMKTFEENFPNLKGKERSFEGIDFFHHNIVYNFCLDAEKVREAIENMPIKASIEPLLKKLGLEREK